MRTEYHERSRCRTSTLDRVLHTLNQFEFHSVASDCFSIVPRHWHPYIRTVHKSAGPLYGRTDVLEEAEQLGAEVRRQQLVGLVQRQQPRPVRLQGAASSLR